MSGQPTEIYSAANSQQAHLLKGLLEERGIAAWVVNDAIQIAGGELPMGWRAAPKVIVGEEDASEARGIAEEFDLRTAHPTSPQELVDQAVATDVWAEWPRCPECGERRSARCTVCGVPGTRFALADIEESGAQVRVLLICDSCDDHFLPEWFRLCAACGHDYGEGIEVESPGRRAEFGARNWLLVALLAVGLLALLAYFSWLLR